MKENIMCYKVNMPKRVQNDDDGICHPEFISGSSEMLNRVQHDTSHFSPSGQRGQGELTLQGGQSTLPNPLSPKREKPFYRHPDITSHCHCELSPARHPEFISGSDEIRPQVQHDASFTRHSEFISESQIRPQVQHDKSFSLFAKLWARKIFARTRPQLKTRFAFGRSMIEMLGVLAIIGVLSIGGLSAYRYALHKHQFNNAMDFINSVYFAANETCVLSDACPLGSVSSQGSKNRDILCGSIGGIACEKSEASYVSFPYFGTGSWGIGLSPASTKFNLFLYFIDTPSYQCVNFVNYNNWKQFPDIYALIISNNVFYFNAQKELLTEDKTAALALCQEKSKTNVILEWVKNK